MRSRPTRPTCKLAHLPECLVFVRMLPRWSRSLDGRGLDPNTSFTIVPPRPATRRELRRARRAARSAVRRERARDGLAAHSLLRWRAALRHAPRRRRERGRRRCRRRRGDDYAPHRHPLRARHGGRAWRRRVTRALHRQGEAGPQRRKSVAFGGLSHLGARTTTTGDSHRSSRVCVSFESLATVRGCRSPPR